MSRSVRRLGSDSHRHGLSTPSRLRPAKHPYHQAGQVVGVPGIDNGEEAEERERETEVYSFPAVLQEQEIFPYEVRVAGLLEVQVRAAEEQPRGEGRGHPVLPAPEALRKRVTRQCTHQRKHRSKDREDLQRPDAAKARDHGGKEVKAWRIKHERLV